MKIKSISNLTIIACALFLTSCKNKTDEICDCFKQAANTYMVKGVKPSEDDLTSMCTEFVGSAKDFSMEDKRKCKACIEDTIRAHVNGKILFTDVEKIELPKLPCGEELIKVIF